MPVRDLLPALLLCLLVSVAIGLGRLMQASEGPVLVPVGPSGLTRLAVDPALADIALIDLPLPGFALLRGDVPRIRAAFGPAIAWKGRPACSPRPRSRPWPAGS